MVEIQIPDWEYTALMSAVTALRVKDRLKFKARGTMSDGSTRVTKFDGTHFYQSILGQKAIVAPISKNVELSGTRICRGDYDGGTFHTDEAMYDWMDRRILDAHTGDHTRRHHPVSVPTPTGQPVRG